MPDVLTAILACVSDTHADTSWWSLQYKAKIYFISVSYEVLFKVGAWHLTECKASKLFLSSSLFGFMHLNVLLSLLNAHTSLAVSMFLICCSGDINQEFSSSFQNRVWQRDQRDMRAIQPDAGYYNDVSKILLLPVEVLWIKLVHKIRGTCQLGLAFPPQEVLTTSKVFTLCYLLLLKSMPMKKTEIG